MRGEAFSNALGKALNGAGLVAIPRGNWREEWVVNTMKQFGVDRNDKRFEPVTIVVGDKPNREKPQAYGLPRPSQ